MMNFVTAIFVLIVSLLLINPNIAVRAQCQAPTISDVITFNIINDGYVNIVNVTFEVHEFYVNCLAASNERERWKFSTVTVVFTASDKPGENQTAYLDLYCLQFEGWKLQPFDEAFQLTFSTLGRSANNTRTNCSFCQGFEAPTVGVPIAGDPIHHCIECPDKCIKEDANSLCIGNYFDSTDCCSFYDNNQCTEQCGVNKEPNSNYDCQCVPYWIGDQCDKCNLTCVNGFSNNTNCSYCICDNGFSGMFCESNIDDCLQHNCQNGVCIDGIDGYTCKCSIGYTGKYCQFDINDCDPNPCQNGGKCVDGVNSYSCICSNGYTGTHCTINIDDCDPNPCQNGSKCVDGVNSYSCICSNGYTGTHCTVNIDDCDPNPCKNGGTCVDGVNSYICICSGSWSNSDCSQCLLPNCQTCSSDIGKCNACDNGYVLNNIGTCEGSCIGACDGKVGFQFNMCLFYCQLTQWRQRTIDCGVSLPKIKPQDLSLSDEAQWRAALTERKKLQAIWMKQVKGKLSTSREQTGTTKSLIRQWKKDVKNALKDHIAWQNYVKKLDSTISFQDFSNLYNKLKENTSATFQSYIYKWSKDFSSFDDNFGDQCQ